MLELVKQRPYAFGLLAAMAIVFIYLVSSGFIGKLLVNTLEFGLLLSVLAYAAYAAFYRRLPLM